MLVQCLLYILSIDFPELSPASAVFTSDSLSAVLVVPNFLLVDFSQYYVFKLPIMQKVFSNKATISLTPVLYLFIYFTTLVFVFLAYHCVLGVSSKVFLTARRMFPASAQTLRIEFGD